MSGQTENPGALVFERLMPHPPEKIWRALTESRLIEQWLMKNDFVAEVGRRFTVRAQPLEGWSGVTNCEVVEVEAPRRLVYRWGDGTESKSGVKTVVTWTLTPSGNGTIVRLVQSGFRPEDRLAHTRMGGGWPHVLERLEQSAGGA